MNRATALLHVLFPSCCALCATGAAEISACIQVTCKFFTWTTTGYCKMFFTCAAENTKKQAIGSLYTKLQ